MDNQEKYFSKKPFEKESNQSLQQDVFTNTNTNTDSDSDEYIDLSSQISDNTSHIFQFHLANDKLKLKYIGKSTYAPDIIIKENFGSESNMSLYSCVYTHEEIESYNIEENKVNIDNIDNIDKLFFPLIKLIVYTRDDKILDETNPGKSNINIKISSIAVKINKSIKYDTELIDWDLYWVENIQSDEYIKMLQIDKTINAENILEKLIELSIGKK